MDDENPLQNLIAKLSNPPTQEELLTLLAALGEPENTLYDDGVWEDLRSIWLSLARLIDHEEASIREQIVRLFIYIADDEKLDDAIISVFIRAAGGANQLVREGALRILATIDDPEVVPPLRQALQDSDSVIRKAAIGTGGLMDPAYVQLLEATANDPDVNIASAAIVTLCDRFPGHPSLAQDLDRLTGAVSGVQLWSESHTVQALALSPDPLALAALERVLVHGSYPNMLYLAMVLRPPGAMYDHFVARVRDTTFPLRATVFESLYRDYRPETQEIMVGLLEEPAFRVRAWVYLVRFAGPEVRPYLEKALSSKQSEVRDRASKALKAIKYRAQEKPET